MLKYVNGETGVPAGVDHFTDRVWESAKPETGVHLPPPQPPVRPAPPPRIPHRHVRIPLLTGRSALLCLRSSEHLDHFPGSFLLLERKKRLCRLPKEINPSAFDHPVEIRVRGRPQTTGDVCVCVSAGPETLSADAACDSRSCHVALIKHKTNSPVGSVANKTCPTQTTAIHLIKIP